MSTLINELVKERYYQDLSSTFQLQYLKVFRIISQKINTVNVLITYKFTVPNSDKLDIIQIYMTINKTIITISIRDTNKTVRQIEYLIRNTINFYISNPND